MTARRRPGAGHVQIRQTEHNGRWTVTFAEGAQLVCDALHQALACIPSDGYTVEVIEWPDLAVDVLDLPDEFIEAIRGALDHITALVTRSHQLPDEFISIALRTQFWLLDLITLAERAVPEPDAVHVRVAPT